MDINYERIERAIYYIKEHFRDQPDLDDVAKNVFVSPYHFQRMFKEWAGVSPKKFLQYISVNHAKQLLKQDASVADATFETGLSSTGRLHDLFISIEGMTPGEYRQGAGSLAIHYSYAETAFGEILIASTPKGICYIAFVGDREQELEKLRSLYPRAAFIQNTDLLQQNALKVFREDWRDIEKIRLHLKATPFQLKVWEALLKVPMGSVTTYAGLAERIDIPGASRAVGSALGSNPVAGDKVNGRSGRISLGCDTQDSHPRLGSLPYVRGIDSVQFLNSWLIMRP